MDSNDENELPKILILGSKGHGQHLTEYLWHEVPNSLNIADYQILVMNYAALSDPEYLNTVELEDNMNEYQFGRLLFSPNSEVVIVGSPNFDFSFTRMSKAAIYWLPKSPQFDYRTGDTIKVLDISFEYYLNEAGVGHSDASYHVEPIAENRYKRPVAFSTIFQVGPYQSGKVIWLPATTKITTRKAIDLILKERYKLISEFNPPEWLDKYPLPNEIPIRTEIASNQEKISQLSTQNTKLELTLREETKFHKLLYESGEGILEPIVRVALRELGATVTDPTVKCRDDGNLVDPLGREGTLEIKGREGSLRLRDINELDRWVRDSFIMDDRPSKGILIGNLKRDQPLNIRGDIFPDNCLQAAKNSQICLLTTSQIYRAIQDKQTGKFNQDEFWNTIFSSNGICNLFDPKEPSVPNNKSI